MTKNRQSDDSDSDSDDGPTYRGLTKYQISVLVAVFGILIIYGYRNIIRKKSFDINDQEVVHEDLKKYKLFTAEELMQYNGEENSKGLYLAIMGDVFDVEKGRQHYGVDGTYHIFAGRDASKAFVTGEFDGKKKQMDHVLSLTPSELVSLKNWRDFYEKDYEYVGKLIGRFYDENGERTEYYWSILRKIQFGLKQKEQEEYFKHDFPPCNVEWIADVGTRVWCTKQSGGIERDWPGYPIQYFNQESKNYICVCAKKELFDLPQLRPYEQCNEAKHECFINVLD